MSCALIQQSLSKQDPTTTVEVPTLLLPRHLHLITMETPPTTRPRITQVTTLEETLVTILEETLEGTLEVTQAETVAEVEVRTLELDQGPMEITKRIL